MSKGHDCRILGMKTKSLIGVDVDEVLCDFGTAFVSYFCVLTGWKRPGLGLKHPNYAVALDAPEKEILAAVAAFYGEPVFRDLAPIEGSHDGIVALREFATLEIVSARPPTTRTATEGWLTRHHNDAFGAVHLTGFAATGMIRQTKAEICEKRGITILIEDNPGYAMQCASRGIEVVLMRHFWNRHLEAGPFITPVETWTEAVDVASNLCAVFS